MKFISYLFDGHDHLALLIDGRLYEMENLHPDIPNTMGMFLQYWDDAFSMAYGGELMVRDGKISKDTGNDPSVADFIAPVPFPASLRFAETTVLGQPSYSFGNHHSIRGEGELSCPPEYFGELSFVPQVAIVIARHGRNIKAEDADSYIGGLMLMNRFRTTSSQHFAAPTGRWLVSPDELTQLESGSGDNHKGKTWDIPIKVRVNSEELALFNTSSLNFSFAELIETASRGIDLYPGDLIACGPLGDHSIRLNEGDIVEIEGEGLGVLSNTIVAEQEMG